jgi:hypothetical protein
MILIIRRRVTIVSRVVSSGEKLAVVLDPDVASVFQSAEAVNSFSGQRLLPCQKHSHVRGSARPDPPPNSAMKLWASWRPGRRPSRLRQPDWQTGAQPPHTYGESQGRCCWQVSVASPAVAPHYPPAADPAETHKGSRYRPSALTPRSLKRPRFALRARGHAPFVHVTIPGARRTLEENES